MNDISNVYLSWLNDRWLMRYSRQRNCVHTLETARAYLASFRQSRNRFVAIRCRRTRELLGTATIFWHTQEERADVGILIGKPGLGYGKEAFCAIVDGLIASGVPRVTAGTSVSNGAMIRLALSAGMREVWPSHSDSLHRFFERIE